MFPPPSSSLPITSSAVHVWYKKHLILVLFLPCFKKEFVHASITEGADKREAIGTFIIGSMTEEVAEKTVVRVDVLLWRCSTSGPKIQAEEKFESFALVANTCQKNVSHEMIRT
mgnify:CR=1 FL=1|tara:strand:+ start:160 stop:501 length:342 start_codon:yes stop_codon:yes gene_type:complete